MTERRPNLLFVGSFVTDMIFTVPRIPQRGETLFGKAFHRFLGGKGVNQAVAAARLGGRVTIVGRVGQDAFGEEHIATMRDEGIDPRGIIRDPDAPTGCSGILLEEDGSNRICMVPGANHRVRASDIDAVEDALAVADAVVCQFEVPDEAVIRVAQLASKHNRLFIFNPAPAREIPEEVLRAVTVLTPNESEASYLTGVEVTDIETGVRAARVLQQRGVKQVVITMGHRGALAITEDSEDFIPALKVDVVDTVGAGDAFTGALAYYLGSGQSLSEAARFANVVAAISVTRRGALPAMPTRQEVEEMRQQLTQKG